MREFNIFGYKFSSYWSMLIIASVLTVILSLFRAKKYKFGKTKAFIIAVLLLFFGCLGTKLLYILEHPENSFSLRGGMSLFGSVYLVPIAFLAAAPMIKENYLKCMDFTAMYGPLIFACMRIGCYFNKCCGGMKIPFFLPVQLMEAVFDTAIFVFLFLYERNKKDNIYGKQYPIFMICYSFVRFFLEFLRNTEKNIFCLSEGQWLSAAAFTIGFITLYFIKKKRGFKMKFTKNTVISLLTAVVLIFMGFQVSTDKTAAATDFTFDTTTGYITGYNGSAKDVVIPDEIAGYKIRGIKEGVFKKKDITTVVIPDTVTAIEKEVFYGCTHLKEINMSHNITAIGESAFENCTAIKKVEIPYSVKTVGKSAFAGCTSLKKVIIPSSVSSIGTYVFSGCSSLVSIVYQAQEAELPEGFCKNCISLAYFEIPDNITQIGESAFEGCKSLPSVDFPKSVDVIGTYAYKNCAGLKNLYIPDTVSTVGYYTFAGCTGLKTAVLDNEHFFNASGCNDTGSKAFADCTNLTDVKILNNMTSIGEETFLNCKALMHVTIPANVVTIPDNAFSGCNTNMTIYCKQNSEALSSALANGIEYSFSEAPEFDNTPVQTTAYKDIDVSINDQYLYFDQEPVIENSRTLVPLRAIFEALGAEVEWDNDTRTITATKDNVTISLQIDNNVMYKNGKAVTLDVPATLKSNRTLVPVRAVSEAFDCDVEWDGSMQTVKINK